MYKLCAIIPVFNHGATAIQVVERVRALGVDVLLVDDGSEPGCAALLDKAARIPGVSLLRREQNGGKGAAVLDGLRRAARQDYSHALQIDADGQHALRDIPLFVDMSRKNPNALIGGNPLYGDDAPKARLYGRWLTRVWVWINTLSRDIPDAMCGFRIYPLAGVLPLIDRTAIAQRMDFDIDIIVRLHWQGVPMLWLPTEVSYPSGGISHFRSVQDNALISRTHARLFFGMLIRLPGLLAKRVSRKAPE